MTRPTSLARLPPEQIGLVLTHPFQTSTIDVLVRLLSELRSLRTFVEYYEFQRKLFGAVFEADTRRSHARRQERRAAAGKPVEECATGSWALESLVCQRVGRQVRLVADALAWRLFNFDRRVVMALSRNDPAGPMTNKADREREIGEVQHAWETEGVFALLHDLTNCLRIADVTKFTSEIPLLVEVKNDPARVGGRQLARMKHAVDVINDGAPLVADDVETELLQSSQQIRTRVRELPAAFEHASKDAQAVLRLGTGWMVVCRDLTSPALGVADIHAKSRSSIATGRQRSREQAWRDKVNTTSVEMRWTGLERLQPLPRSPSSRWTRRSAPSSRATCLPSRS